MIRVLNGGPSRSSTCRSVSPIETGPIDESRTTPGGAAGVAVVVVGVALAGAAGTELLAVAFGGEGLSWLDAPAGAVCVEVGGRGVPPTRRPAGFVPVGA